MATTTISGSTVVFSNSTAAANLTDNSLTEDSSSLTLSFDVLALSGGGAKTTLWSVDNGTVDTTFSGALSNNFVNYDTDLLTKDGATSTWQLGGDTSALGAHVWIGSDNKVHYDASGLASQISHLGVGETFADTYEYTIRMSNGTLSVGHISVNIAGENDAAVILGQTTGSVIEDASATPAGTEGTSETTQSATLTFTDNDWHDTHTASVGASSNLGQLTLASTNGIVDDSLNGGTGHIGWTYTVDDSAINYLSQGETKLETFTVNLDEHHPDGSMTTDPTTVSITVTGTNDTAFIVGATTGQVTEDTTPTTDGILAFTDPDSADTHTSGLVADGTLGHATVDPITLDSTGNVTGQIDWHYTVDNGLVDHLSQGQTATDMFTVGLTEHYGSFSQLDTQNVTVTVTGTNDAAQFATYSDTTGHTTASVVDYDTSGDAAPTPVTGTIAFSDADWADTHQVLSIDQGTWGTLTADVTTDSSVSGNGTGGLITWHFNIDDATLDSLSPGVHSETFAIHLLEQYGAFTNEVTQDVTINLTGGPDLPAVDSDTSHDFDTIADVINGGFITQAQVNSAGGPNGQSGTFTGTTAADVLIGDNGDNQINAGNGNDTVLGQAGVDQINGSNGNDVLFGQAGNDIIIGDNGVDTIYGGSGNDRITGSGGADHLWGGSGNDTFVYTAASDSSHGSGNYDTIHDFHTSYDKIDFSAIAGLNSSATINFVSSVPTQIAANTIDVVTTGGNAVIYANASGSTETTTSADMEIHLTGVTSMTSSDFILHA